MAACREEGAGQMRRMRVGGSSVRAAPPPPSLPCTLQWFLSAVSLWLYCEVFSDGKMQVANGSAHLIPDGLLVVQVERGRVLSRELHNLRRVLR